MGPANRLSELNSQLNLRLRDIQLNHLVIAELLAGVYACCNANGEVNLQFPFGRRDTCNPRID